MREDVPKRDIGHQSARKSFVQARIQDPPPGEKHYRLYLGLGCAKTEVYTNFFTAVTGLSRDLINTSTNAGSLAM